MSIDLHSHSILSDGTDSPAELVRRARRHDVHVLALTDHDHARGWPEATAAAAEVGIELVPGIEVSTRHQIGHDHAGVHLLAYYPDPDQPRLAEELRRIREGREERIPAWVAAGERAGIPIDEQRLRALVAGVSVSKNHVADLLLEDGVVSSRDEAFHDLLGEGRPLFVRRYALGLLDAIGLVREAGGAPVVAHPWGRAGSRRVLPEAAWPALVDAGLAGIEVDHRQHDPDTRARLRELAASYDLVVTGSSDHHGTNKTDHELGCEQTAPEQLERIRVLAGAVT